jgi:hypothetical protein
VVLLELEPTPPALLASLQIQLSSLVQLLPRTASDAMSGMSERVRSASALARSEGALAVVWIDPAIERSDGGREATLYVVGERDGRALVEVVSVTGEQGPELDRTLALKLREILAELLSQPSPVPSSALLRPERAVDEPREPGSAADGRQPESAAESSTTTRPESAWGLSVAVGPRWVSQPWMARWGVGIAAGPTLQLTHVRLGVALGLDWLPEASEQLTPLSASISELLPQLRFQVQVGGPSLFATLHTGPALSLLTATGYAPPRESERGLALFSWLVGVGGELAFGAGWGCAAHADLYVFTRHQRIDVENVNLIDLGRVRAAIGLDLLGHVRP